jgi:Domain of unknown function (DUF1816)
MKPDSTASILSRQSLPRKVFLSWSSLVTNLIPNNKIAMKILTIWTNALNFLGRAWWIEVLTTQPKCTYYFGPFAYIEEAKEAIKDYIEDLESESAQGIQTKIKRCKPNQLTIDHDVIS